MTEAEWLVCDDLYQMLEFVQGSVSDRKLRLFAVACCHRPYYYVPDERHRSAVQLAQRLADEEVDNVVWESIYQPARQLWEETWAASRAAQLEAPRGTPEVERLVDADMATAAGWVILDDAWEAAYQVTGVAWRDSFTDEPEHQLAFWRDIFGNPFRPVAFDPSWLTSDVVAMARGMYETRDFAAMPILADALQDAGCENADVLNHCRGDGPHVRGCWVVDLVLGKE